MTYLSRLQDIRYLVNHSNHLCIARFCASICVLTGINIMHMYLKVLTISVNLCTCRYLAVDASIYVLAILCVNFCTSMYHLCIPYLNDREEIDIMPSDILKLSLLCTTHNHPCSCLFRHHILMSVTFFKQLIHN